MPESDPLRLIFAQLEMIRLAEAVVRDELEKLYAQRGETLPVSRIDTTKKESPHDLRIS